MLFPGWLAKLDHMHRREQGQKALGPVCFECARDNDIMSFLLTIASCSTHQLFRLLMSDTRQTDKVDGMRRNCLPARSHLFAKQLAFSTKFGGPRYEASICLS